MTIIRDTQYQVVIDFGSMFGTIVFINAQKAIYIMNNRVEEY